MDAYAEYFALGTKTGVELSESSGIMSSPQEYAENNPGFTWTDGLTAQTAIGQCDNMFTPIQLATYCATIANGGVRLRTHFLDKITNYTGDEVVEPISRSRCQTQAFPATCWAWCGGNAAGSRGSQRHRLCHLWGIIRLQSRQRPVQRRRLVMGRRIPT